MTAPPQAPELPEGYPWINSDPLALRHDLAGHVVLLHFFAASSIYCQHVLSTLAFLEQRHADRLLAILGIHAGKFAAEHDPDHVALAVQQYGLRHPVLVDRDLSVWRAYDVRSWPTLVLVDATGRIRFQGAGEPDRDRLSAAVEALLDEAEAGDAYPGSPPTPSDRTPLRPLEGLRFPTKLAVDTARNLLWIADTGNHRVVAVHIETGEAHTVVGSGIPGAAGGSFAGACFFAPRGIAVDLREVYVADTGNHLLRRIDLEAGTVGTVLGQGKRVVDFLAGRSGSDQGLNSPWALAMAGDAILVAMAGNHQLWKVNKDTMTAEVLAGRGAAGLQDARLRGAALAQPMGLSPSPDGHFIAFVDSEASAVRVAKVEHDWVNTLVGEGLFDWGDRDGLLLTARLQHPEDVAHGRNVLFVADTFNHKVKRIDLDVDEPADRTIATILGDGDLRLRGPEGLAVHHDQNLLFVADTRNHRILKGDLTDDTWSELEITGLPPGHTGFGTEYLRAQPLQLAPMADITLSIPLAIPEGARIHPEAPATLRLENVEGHPLLVDMTLTPQVDGDVAIAENVSTSEESDGVVGLRLTYMTCHELDHVCHVHEIRRELPVQLVQGGQTRGKIVV